MANALVALVAPVFRPELVARIAASLGVTPAIGQTLIRAAIPAVLAAFGAKASSPEGAIEISELVSGQYVDLIGEIERSADGAGADDLIVQGTRMLSSCLGGDTIAALAKALSSFTGAPEAAGSSVLALVTTALVGALGRLPPAEGSTGEGITALFAAASRPPGDAAATAAQEPQEEDGATVETLLEDQASRPHWGLWLLGAGVVAAAGLALILFPASVPPPAPPVAAPVQPAVVVPALPVAPPAPSAEAIRLHDQLSAMLETLGATLATVSDPVSARSAQFRLAAIAADLDMLGDQVASQPPQGMADLKAALAAKAGPLAEQLRAILAQQDIGGILKPVSDPLLARLGSFAGP